MNTKFKNIKNTKNLKGLILDISNEKWKLLTEPYLIKIYQIMTL